MADMVITTSILEGFGFVYIEPWYAGTAVIGRDLPLVTEDFNKAGMDLGHLYRVLMVEGTDYKDLFSELEPQEGLIKRLEMVLRLEDLKFLRKIQSRNEPALNNTLRLFNPEFRERIIKHNRKVVMDTYSQDRVASELYEIISSKTNAVDS
jgi:glycosyltransferase involved in cell wall biosynthesis